MIPLRSGVRTRSFPWATLGLCVACLSVFLLEPHMPIDRFWLVPSSFVDALTSRPERIDHWLLPLLSSMFLHAGWAHLLGNLLFLWVFGRVVEATLGARRYLALYGLAGIAAAMTHVAMTSGDPASSDTVPLVGASGAIAGVLGAALALHPRAPVTVVIPILVIPFLRKISAFVFLFVWFLEQIVAGTIDRLLTQAPGGVAWWAHVGGFVAGFVLPPILRRV
jgi:membrane associated rhomboid family serine protease